MLLTLVSSSNAENADVLWGFIGRYRPGVTPQTHPKLDTLVGYAIHYFRDFVLPQKRFREPDAGERAALLDLRDALSQLPADATAEQIQQVVYEIGRRRALSRQDQDQGREARGGARVVLNILYQVLLGQEKGPRFGSFVAVYGLNNTIEMINGALANRCTHLVIFDTRTGAERAIRQVVPIVKTDAPHSALRSPLAPGGAVEGHCRLVVSSSRNDPLRPGSDRSHHRLFLVSLRRLRHGRRDGIARRFARTISTSPPG